MGQANSKKIVKDAEATTLLLKDKLIKIEANKLTLAEEEAQLAKKKLELDQEGLVAQQELDAIEFAAEKNHFERMARLDRQVRELQTHGQDSSQSRPRPFGGYHAVVGNALEEFCRENKKGVCSYFELDNVAKLVEETLNLARKDKPDFDLLNEKFKAIEEKARELEGPKSIFKRKLSKALLGVGVVLALGAVVTFILFLSPVMLPVVMTTGIGAMFGVSSAFAVTGFAGGMMAMIGHDGLRGDSNKMPLLSQSLFKLRDTIKDVKAGRDPNDFSLRKVARSIMR